LPIAIVHWGSIVVRLGEVALFGYNIKSGPSTRPAKEEHHNIQKAKQHTDKKQILRSILSNIFGAEENKPTGIFSHPNCSYGYCNNKQGNEKIHTYTKPPSACLYHDKRLIINILMSTGRKSTDTCTRTLLSLLS